MLFFKKWVPHHCAFTTCCLLRLLIVITVFFLKKIVFLQCIHWSENLKSENFFQRMNPRILIPHRLHNRRASIFNANIQESQFFDYQWAAVVQKFSHSIHASLENEDIVEMTMTRTCKSLPWATIIWPSLLAILPFITPNDSKLSTCCTTTARVELAMMTFLCNEGCLSLLKILCSRRNFIWYLARG